MADVYPETVSRRIERRKFAGVCASANAAGNAAVFRCGTLIGFTLRVAPDSGKVDEIRFSTTGCGFMIAAADILAEQLTGQALVSLQGPDAAAMASEIVGEIGPMPNDRDECIIASIDAIKAAFANFRSRRIAEFAGEQALICTCFGITEAAIEARVSELNLVTVEDVARETNAGSGCGSCRMLIQAIIDSRGR
jgi:NifU-like protein